MNAKFIGFLRNYVDRILIALMLVLHLLPIWLLPYYPTQDGPSHIANAVIVKEYAQHDIYQEYFQLNLKPVPNWFSHAAMALFMFFTPPLIAEKLLLTLYAILFPISLFYFVDAVHRGKYMLGFIGFIFMYNYLLHMGFYNFAFSVPMYFIAVGYWWKHRASFGSRRQLILNLLFIFTYFCHLVSLVLAIATVLLLAITTLRRSNLKSRLLLPVTLIPSYVLPWWYFSYRPANPGNRWSFQDLYTYFIKIGSIATYTDQQWVSRFLLSVLVAVLIYTFIDRFNIFRWDAARKRFKLVFRASDNFYLVFAMLMFAYFVAPDGMSGGGFITTRLCLYPLLALLPALNQDYRRPFRYILGGAIIALVLLQLQMNVRYHKTFSDTLAEYGSGTSVIEHNKVLMGLSFNSNGSFTGNRTDVFGHAIGYYAAETRGVDVDNYEATTDYFPVKFNPELSSRGRPDFEGRDTESGEPVNRVDYIVTWRMDLNLPVAGRIQEQYQQIYASDSQRLRIFARKKGL